MLALIRIIPAYKDATVALKSVLRLKKRFRGLIIVCPDYDSVDHAASFGVEAAKIVAQLSDGDPNFIRIRPLFNEYDAEVLAGAKLVVEIPIDCEIKESAMERIEERFEAVRHNPDNRDINNYALQPMVKITDPTVLDLLWYGFLIVSMYIDFWIMALNRNKHSERTDVMVRIVQASAGRSYLPQWSFWRRFR